MVDKSICLFLCIFLLSACSTKKVTFTSSPPGARISAGEQSCTTPCSLHLNNEISAAQIIGPGWETRAVQLPEMGNGEMAATSFLEGGKWGLGGIGAACTIVGLVGFGLVELDEDSDSELKQLKLYSLITTGVGVGFIWLADLANESKPDSFKVHVDFFNELIPDNQQPASPIPPTDAPLEPSSSDLSEDNLFERIQLLNSATDRYTKEDR